MNLTGPALVFGDEINTDELHPSRFYSLDDVRVRSGFLRAVEGKEDQGQRPFEGAIVVAGRTFGIGSSRETGARVFRLAGIRALVAVSFARIFHRNLLNLGLLAVTAPGLATVKPADGELVTVDLAANLVRFGPHALPIEPLDPHWRAVLDAGGLAAYLGIEER